jgi:hypothetical protein
VCPPGFDDCNGLPGDGCEINLTNDAAHCGWCDHDCLGTACVASMCAPDPVADPQGNPGNPWNGYLALSATHVYFGYNGLNSGGVSMALKDGTSPGCVACDQGTPRELATDSTHVYWADQGQDMLRRALLNGTGATTIWYGQLGSPNAPVAVDGSYVYWFSESTGEVMHANPDGTNPLPLANGQANVNSIATDGTYVYWIAGTNIMAVDLVGGLPVPLSPGGTEPKSVAVDGTHVYWAEGNWNAPQKRVRRVDKTAGGVPEDIGTYSGAWAIALDATHVYCAGSGPNPVDNAIWRVPKAGGPPPQVYVTDLNYPFDVAVDATHVYWSSEVDGGVDRIAK